MVFRWVCEVTPTVMDVSATSVLLKSPTDVIGPYGPDMGFIDLGPQTWVDQSGTELSPG